MWGCRWVTDSWGHTPLCSKFIIYSAKITELNGQVRWLHRIGADAACFPVAFSLPLGFQLTAQPTELRWDLASLEKKKS